MTQIQRENGKPLASWTMDSQEALARVIRRVAGLDEETASDITKHAAENGEATFMTATVMLHDGDFVPVADRRGLARWRVQGGPGWRLLLMARET